MVFDFQGDPDGRLAGYTPRRSIVRVLLLGLSVALAGLAMAQTAPAKAWADRDIAAQYWVDSSGKASLAGARAAFDAGQGQPADPAQVMPLGGGAAVWYRMQMPAVTETARAVLTVTFPGTDSVDLFRPDGAGGWRAQHSGDVLPVSEWPVPDLHPTFAFVLQPGETQATYLRVQNAYPIRVNWVLWDARTFNTASKGWHLALGAYIGCIAAGGPAQRRQHRLVARPHPPLLRDPRRPGGPERPVAHRAGRRIPLAEPCLVERQGPGGAAGVGCGLGGTVRARAGGRARPAAGVVVAAGPGRRRLRGDAGLPDAGARALLSGAHRLSGAVHVAHARGAGVVRAAPPGGGPVGAGGHVPAGAGQRVAADAQPGLAVRVVPHAVRERRSARPWRFRWC